MASYSAELQDQPLKAEDGDIEKGAQLISFDREHDPELRKYGGKYTHKCALGQVTIRCPEYNPIAHIAILYGYLPFIIPGGFFILGFVYGRFMGKFGFFLALSCTIANELFFKPLANDPRPIQSANKTKAGTPTHGMPSGHVLNAYTLMIWSSLEVIFARDPESQQIQLWWFIVILVIMLPVPWARWYNYDHTLMQCLVSVALALVIGTTAFEIRTKYFSDHWQPWEAKRIATKML